MQREGGQATVEWVGLVLLAALVLGALAGVAAGRAPAEGRALGEALAKRILPSGARRSRDGAEWSRAVVERAAPVAGRGDSAPHGARRAAPVAPARPPQAAGFLDRIPGLRSLVRHAWVACLGYRRWRYERRHVVAGTEPLPLDEGVRSLNSCLNPYSFLTED
jgi:hypothetical protein